MTDLQRRFGSVVVLAILVASATRTLAVSAVFNGDPVNPATGLPYELLPGFPLIQPGPDGVLGTPDDIVDPSIVGDIDLVVRSGSPAASTIIPGPLAAGDRSLWPVGTAGSPAAGGTEIPFTVFLSDGATSSVAPSGRVLAASDMDGIPVIVAAFADLDGDGFIGPTDRDGSNSSDNGLEVRELEPVGRAVALFSGGIARGSVAVRTGLPQSAGGLVVVLTALAVTGPLDPNFFSGIVPTGPAISTAQPFLPERDLSKLIRDRPAPVGPNTTLQDVIRFASVPPANAALPLALPVDGSASTIDVAIVQSQFTASVAFREDVPGSAVRRTVDRLELGTRVPGNSRRIRLVPIDRWGNPSDPPSGFSVTVHATPPLQVVRPSSARNTNTVSVRSSAGIRLTVKIPPGTVSGTTGLLTAERDGAVVAAVECRVDTRADRPRADVAVPSQQTTSIQAAIDGVTDRNKDGILVVHVGPGLYRENLQLNRSVLLRGDGAATLIQGDANGSVVTASAPNVTVRDLTVVGGREGFTLNGANDVVDESRAWRNLGAGVHIAGGALVVDATAEDNGAEGVLINGTGGVCSTSSLIDNIGAGASVSNAQGTQLDNNLIGGNAGGGIKLVSASAAVVTDNRVANNLGVGIQLSESDNNQIVGNLCTLSDDDGLHIDHTSGNLISGNIFDTNHGYGMFIRRSSDDFGAASGTQDPPGDNTSINSRKGDVFIRIR